MDNKNIGIKRGISFIEKMKRSPDERHIFPKAQIMSLFLINNLI